MASSMSTGKECCGSLVESLVECESAAALGPALTVLWGGQGIGAGAGKVGGNLDRHGVGLRAVLFGGDQHAADGAGLWRLIADLHGEFNPILGTRQFLGRRIFDPSLSVGEKRQRPDLRQHRAPVAAQRDHQLIAVNPRARRSRLRTGQIAACRGEQRRFCRIEAAGLGTERHF
jgi:hypothetical protein